MCRLREVVGVVVQTTKHGGRLMQRDESTLILSNYNDMNVHAMDIIRDQFPTLRNQHTDRCQQFVWLRRHFCRQGPIQRVYVVGLLPAVVSCCLHMVCLLAAVGARCII